MRQPSNRVLRGYRGPVERRVRRQERQRHTQRANLLLLAREAVGRRTVLALRRRRARRLVKILFKSLYF